jgi:hypothetical protein
VANPVHNGDLYEGSRAWWVGVRVQQAHSPGLESRRCPGVWAAAPFDITCHLVLRMHEELPFHSAFCLCTLLQDFFLLALCMTT